ncbi:MAG: helix-turn-helix transcriptional regulator [Clostridiales bacterium]|nr:helix-turn-helix transcriptional regulator [Clostridiales bacterium]
MRAPVKPTIILSKWSKEVRKAMIDRDMGLKELCEETGYSKVYLSNIINCRAVGCVIAEEKISKVLGIPYPYPA